MSKSIHIARGLELPLDAATQVLAFLGRRGSGKTYAAGVFVEGLLKARVPVVVLDWIGNWYGLRIAADGKGKGFDITVFGGEHGDVPLEPGAGALIADLIVDRELSAVLDVSQFRKGQRQEFATAFGEQLFHRKKRVRSPLHVVLEEAQVYVPQQVGREKARLVGAWEDIGRLGRNYGLGISFLSQRPQSVNKEVLNQAEALFVFQTSGAHERKAIRDWVVYQGIDVDEMAAELPGLKVGTAYLWSPQWLRILKRVQIVQKQSFDASSTPTVRRAKAIEPRPLTAEDLRELEASMAEVVQRAAENDPKALKRRVAELERELRQARAAASSPSTEILERARSEGAREAERRLATFIGRTQARDRRVATAIGESIVALEKAGSAMREPIDVELGPVAARGDQKRHSRDHRAPIRDQRAAIRDQRGPRQPAVHRHATSGPDWLRGPHRKILDAIAWLNWIRVEVPTKVQVAAVAGYAVNGGGFRNPLGRLRSEGLVGYREADGVVITEDGRALAREPDEPPTVEEMHRRVLETLPGNTHRRIMRAVLDAYPSDIGTDELAEKVGMEPSGGGFRNPLGRLRTLGLIDYPERGQVVAQPVLFLE